jgi:putative flippase GtrA
MNVLQWIDSIMLSLISFIASDEKKKESLHQFGKFVIIGFINTGIDFGIYYLLTRHTPYFNSETNYKYIANVIGFVCAATCSYLANRYWTFTKTTSISVSEASKFYLITAMGLGINSLLFAFFVKTFGLHDILAKAIATVFVILWNFILQKIWVFSSTKNK